MIVDGLLSTSARLILQNMYNIVQHYYTLGLNWWMSALHPNVSNTITGNWCEQVKRVGFNLTLARSIFVVLNSEEIHKCLRDVGEEVNKCDVMHCLCSWAMRFQKSIRLQANHEYFLLLAPIIKCTHTHEDLLMRSLDSISFPYTVVYGISAISSVTVSLRCGDLHIQGLGI